MGNKKVSGKKHTKEQLDSWANQHNPNNKAYQTNMINHTNQMNPKHQSHPAQHNGRRRAKNYISPDWNYDYFYFDE